MMLCDGVIDVKVSLGRERSRSTAESVGGGLAGVSGGLAGGRAPLGPDPTHQLPPRMLSMNVL